MCGVVGVIAKTKNVIGLIREVLQHLAYRGYDSVGVCLESNGLNIYRSLGEEHCLDIAVTHAKTGIGHARWATHGPALIRNAPHNSHGRVAIVHNGVVQNYLTIKGNLEEKGYEFRSETDSEVIAHFLR